MTRSMVIIHPGALGDVLLAVPAIQGLREKYPLDEVLLVAQEPIGRFLRTCNVIDAWISIDHPDAASLFSSCVMGGGELDSWMSRCERAVVWLKDEEGIVHRRLASWRVREIIGASPFSSVLKSAHQSDRFLESLGEQGCVSSDNKFLRLPGKLIQDGFESLVQQGLRVEKPFAVLHPGSGSRSKCSNPFILDAVLRQLQEQGMQVLILEGPADQESVEALRRFVRTPIHVIRDLDLETVAGLLHLAQVYIGHDSGITHLAGLVGVPTLAFFGPTDPGRWAPRGSHVRVLRGRPCTCATWEEVRLCKLKTCLNIPLSEVVDVCGIMEEMSRLSPCETLCRTLSPLDPYAKVARSFSLSMVRT